jgi:glycosyltransferase involved in cell wall biosynthesis
VKSEYLLTIVTVNYNNLIGLKKTALSMFGANGIEWIIVDGGSTDGSTDFISELSPSKAIIGVDNGIYNAMNLGLRASSAKFVMFLNSGDCLRRETFEEVLQKVKEDNSDIISSSIIIGNKMTPLLRLWGASFPNRLKILTGWTPPHPGLIVRKQLLKQIGGFNEKFKVIADYDLIIKLLHLKDVKFDIVPNVLVVMEPGGVSNNSIKSVLINNFDILRSWSDQRYYCIRIIPIWLLLTKPFQKIFQIRINWRGIK